MGKTKETRLVEEMLAAKTRNERIYGCEEVTIGFYRDGGGNERVDFMTMDSKDIFKCYEIKVTIEDLKSRAKKSFYGHYNYLAVTKELYNKMAEQDIDLVKYNIPKWAGIIVFDTGFYAGTKNIKYGIESVRKAQKQDISEERADNLKSSLIRTLYWKMDKYQKISNAETFSALEKEIKHLNQNKKEMQAEHLKWQNSLSHAKHYINKQYGIRPQIYIDNSCEEWVQALSLLIDTVSYKSVLEYIMKKNGVSEEDLKLAGKEIIQNAAGCYKRPEDAAKELLKYIYDEN